jgi:hypothetical protein
VVDQQFLKPSARRSVEFLDDPWWLSLRKSEYVNFGGALIATVEEKFAARWSMALFMGGIRFRIQKL